MVRRAWECLGVGVGAFGQERKDGARALSAHVLCTSAERGCHWLDLLYELVNGKFLTCHSRALIGHWRKSTYLGMGSVRMNSENIIVYRKHLNYACGD